MAFNLPASAIAQPDETAGRDSSENLTKAFSWKGPYSELETAGRAIVKGDVIVAGENGWIASAWNVRRTPGDCGILTVECTPPNPAGTDEHGAATVEPLKDVWSVRAVRSDVSIMAYCGPSEGVNPNRAAIEAWMREPDAALADQDKFKSENGEIQELSQASKDLVAKIRRGVEAVIRHYPVLTRTRTYADVPPACLENLNCIDSPPVPADAAATRDKKPNGLKTAADKYQWLKCQDDAIEQTDGQWTRVESWMGILKTDGEGNSPWDANLYDKPGAGSQRWPMPYEHI